MATNLTWSDTAGVTDYFVATNSSGQYMNGTTAEAYNAAHWITGDYCNSSTSVGSAFTAAWPAYAADTYQVIVYRRAGASPAPPSIDFALFAATVTWDGTNLVISGGTLSPIAYNGANGGLVGILGATTVNAYNGNTGGLVQVDVPAIG